jgi:predicted Zn-dependent protease
MDGVDVASAARTAADKAARSQGAVDGEPGTYEVVLEPPAVAMLIDFLSYMGFGAKQVIEGESFLSSHAGGRVAADLVTVADDVFADGSVGIGFDMEGVPKQRVEVIEGGRATGPVSDRRTARKLGTPPTGHYSGSSEFGPYAFNLVMVPGESSLEDLIGGISQGLLVTRFHYVNILDRPATSLTGMTRDGTFRISGGEVGEAVHNFRFTQNVLGALLSVDGIGSKLAAFAPEYGSFGSTVAPAVRMREFNLASTTSH